MMNVPLVSIGMPLYNEERYLQESLQSIAAQDYPNIEMVLCDNASTDSTQEICKRFEEQHHNVSIHIVAEHSSPTKNFMNALNNANGEFFMWASGHDLWASDYVSSCARELEANGSAALAFGSAIWINEKGDEIDRQFGWSDTRGMSVIERYFTILWGNMHPVVGVMRINLIRKYPLVNTVGWDLLVLTQMIFEGDFVHARGTHWSRRESRIEVNYREKLKRYKSKEYSLAKTRLGKLFPLAMLPLHLLKIVVQADIRVMEKLLILSLLPPTFLVRYVAKLLEK